MALATFGLMLTGTSTAKSSEFDEAQSFEQHIRPFVTKYCVRCHGAEEAEAEVRLHTATSTSAVLAQRKLWERVVTMVESGQMPPPPSPGDNTTTPPPPAVALQFVEAVTNLFEAADRLAPPDPGRVTVRRLNRAEYLNTTRDLFGIDFDPTENFPSDEIGHGFDNIGDVLTLSPILMERYLSAAEAITERVFSSAAYKTPQKHFNWRMLEPPLNVRRDARFRRMTTFFPREAPHTGPLLCRFKPLEDERYVFRARCYGFGGRAEHLTVAAFVTGKELRGTLDRETAQTLVGFNPEEAPLTILLGTKVVQANHADRAELVEFTIPQVPGIERFGMAIVAGPTAIEGNPRSGTPPAAGAGKQGSPDTDPESPLDALTPSAPPIALYVEGFSVEGPLDPMPARIRRLFAAPEGLAREDQYRTVLGRLATRMFRRPVLPTELDRLVQLAMTQGPEGQPWELGLQRATQALLVSPKFLFRLELDDRPTSETGNPPSGPTPPVRISEYQLASRLSYFLWSTLPDEELFALAEKGELSQQLEPQVRRMLRHPRARALVENFGMQWLQLRRLKIVTPDPGLFPRFNEPLRQAMAKETELFFEAIVNEDRSVLELLDAKFTYLNEPLAQLYGIADTQGNRVGQPASVPGGTPIRGPNFVRVNLTAGDRGGLLTQASILTVTSNPTRTSPVKRGRWLLEQILGAPPPPPPPNVPELVEGKQAELTGSLRQRMEQHRANPACANCHAKMDALGFAFERYNAIGELRDRDGEHPIETAGVLPGGIPFETAGELKAQLVQHRADQFSRCLIDKLLTYALGRGLEVYDRRTVASIQSALKAGEHRFSALVVAIVQSEPFCYRRGIIE